MAAEPKVTPEDRVEIARRHAAGETYTAIGERLGFPHSTIARNHQKELAREAAEQAERDAQAAAEREEDEYLEALSDEWTMTFDPYAAGELYPTEEYCYAYWASRRDGAVGRRAQEIARANYTDVFVLHRLTPDEVRATAHGRPLFKHPPGTRAARVAARRRARIVD